VLKFEPDGPSFTGPPSTIAARYTTSVGQPLLLPMWVTDEGPKLNQEPAPAGGRGRGRGRGTADGLPPVPPLAVTWSLFRGPAAVTFDKPKPSIDRADGGKTMATATFTEPGEYILRLEATDSSGVGGGGFQCCWTTAHVAVTVKPAGSTK
jgi:hypothetical protein